MSGLTLENKKDERAKAIENNPCGLCKAAGLPICRGHARGAGGKSEELDEEDLDMKSSERAELTLELKPTLPSSLGWEQLNALFLMTNLASQGIFSLRPRPKLALENDREIQEFIRQVKLEFDQFKQVLEKKGIPVEHYSATINKNELIIRIPSPKMYDAFIQQLVNKNLLANQLTPRVSPQMTPVPSLTPFAINPAMAPTKLANKDADDELVSAKKRRVFNPSPFKGFGDI